MNDGRVKKGRWSVSVVIAGSPQRFEIGLRALDSIPADIRALGASCISEWSLAQQSRLHLVAMLCRTNRDIVARDLFKRKSAREQRDTLKLLGNAALDGEAREQFILILDRLYAAERARDFLAHGLWAVRADVAEISEVTLLNPNCADGHELLTALQEEAAKAIANKGPRADKIMKQIGDRFNDLMKSIEKNNEEAVWAVHTADSLKRLLTDIRDATNSALAFSNPNAGNGPEAIVQWFSPLLPLPIAEKSRRSEMRRSSHPQRRGADPRRLR